VPRLPQYAEVFKLRGFNHLPLILSFHNDAEGLKELANDVDMCPAHRLQLRMYLKQRAQPEELHGSGSNEPHPKRNRS
jgi:hypothetical protein